MNLLVDVRDYGGTHIATALSGKHRKQASSTRSRVFAAEAVVLKVIGGHAGDQPRLIELNDSQFMADMTALEGFETVHEGQCSNCYAQHKTMFKRGRQVFCTGCAIRERSRPIENRKSKIGNGKGGKRGS